MIDVHRCNVAVTRSLRQMPATLTISRPQGKGEELEHFGTREGVSRVASMIAKDFFSHRTRDVISVLRFDKRSDEVFHRLVLF
jgi:hypothetical protein